MDGIVTVSSSSFLQGTIILFKSILHQNNAFKGGFLVIDAGLNKEDIKSLKEEFPCEIIEPSPPLKDKIAQLVSAFPSYSKSSKRFYSLEIFNLPQYSKILYLDSDILCTGNIEELFKIDAVISAVADPRFYRGFVRQKKTLIPVQPNKFTQSFPEAFIPKLFNTGMMLINNEKLPNGSFHELVININSNNFEKIKTGHTDTVVLNKLFLENVNWLPLKWNGYTDLDLSEVDDLKFIHYLHKNKPWEIKNESKASAAQKLWLEENKRK